MADLPAGFVLDQPKSTGLPAGFVLDSGPQEDERNFVARYLNPRREDYPEYPVAGTAESQLAAERNPHLRGERSMSDLISGDQLKITQDKYGNDMIVTPRGTFYSNKPGPSLNDIPSAGNAIFNTVKEAAPYLAGGAAAAGAKLATGVGVQAATGLASESIDQTGNAIAGKEVDLRRLATTPLFAGMGEFGGRAVFAVMKPVISKLFGSSAPQRIVNENGTLTDDAIKALSTVDPAQVDDLALQELSKMQQQGVLTKEQAERFNFFKNQGIEPTRAQVTRNADDFQLQQEAAKTSTGVRNALEGQESAISNAFDTNIRGTGGNATTSGSPVADAVLNKATQLDSEISRLYKSVRDAAPGEKVVSLDRYAQNLRARAPDNELTGGLIRSLRGDLMERGIVDNKFKVVGKIDVETAETVRQVINQRYNSTNDFGRQILKQLKESLDADVLTTSGDDLFQEARKAKASFEAGLRPESLSKFDTNERSLVRNILENKIKAEDVFQQAVLSKSWKASDLRELKTYLTRGSAEQVKTGTQAWNDLRAEAVQWIKDQTFRNAESQLGEATMRSGAIKSSLDKIGAERMSELFTGEERQFLNAMARLETLRQPVPMTGNGKGPSAQAIAGLQRTVSTMAGKFNVLGPILEIFQNQSKAINALTTPVPAAISQASAAAARRTVIPPAGAVGAVGGNKLLEEN
jgi:hypothetical protein